MKVEIFTDGSVSRKPDGSFYGSWAFIILVDGNEVYNAWESSKNTTINRMELEGIIKAIEHIIPYKKTKGITVEIFSDSEYSVKGYNDYLLNWIKKGWRLASGKPVKNKEYWERLKVVMESFSRIKLTHIKAHQTIEAINEDYKAFMNDKVDKLAVGAKNDMIYAAQKNIVSESKGFEVLQDGWIIQTP